MKKLALALIVVLAFLLPWIGQAYGAEIQDSTVVFTDDEAELLGALITLGIMFSLAIYLASCIVVGFAAKSKGLSWTYFIIISVFATPLFGILAVIAFSPKQKSGITQVAGKLVEITGGEK